MSGCWLWLGGLNTEGYGQIRFRGANMMAHRAVYILLTGRIPEDTLDHLCRVRSCVNPDHLDPVTMRVNALRGNTIAARNAAVTHCPQGHEYDADNTAITTAGSRRCRTCRNEMSRRAKARRRGCSAMT